MPIFQPVEYYEETTLNTPKKSTIRVVKGTIPSLDGTSEHTVYGYSINGQPVPDEALSMSPGVLFGMIANQKPGSTQEITFYTGQSAVSIQHRFAHYKKFEFVKDLLAEKGMDSEEYLKAAKECTESWAEHCRLYPSGPGYQTKQIAE